MPFFAALSHLAALAPLLAAMLGARAATPDRAQAMDYLAAELPKATAGNPKYLTVATGVLSQWLTQDISFESGDSGAVTMTMRERFSQSHDGATTWGRHEATFSLADVTISAFQEPGDATPSGAPAAGILFTCAKPGCIAAVWGDAPSRADKTDIYVADEAARARILDAFRLLAQ